MRIYNINELSPSVILRIRAADPSVSLQGAVHLLKAANYLDTTQSVKNIVRPERRVK